MTSIYLSAFIIGLMGSVHCLGMCGAIVGVLSANLDASVRANTAKLALYQLSYNIGRIMMYILLGGVFAGFSYALASSIAMSEFEIGLRVFAGVLMILIGLFILGVNNTIRVFERLGQGMWQRLSQFSKRFLPVTTIRQALLFGLFWGGIPCGLVYSALALTLTVTPLEGMVIMAFFGLGTLPALLAIAGFGFSLVRILQTTTAKRFAGVSIILLGIWSVMMPLQHSGHTVHDSHTQEHSHQNMHHH